MTDPNLIVAFGVVAPIVFIILRLYQRSSMKERERLRDERWSKGKNIG